MGSKVNCWEVKNCGRQPGGAKVAELGICPVIDTKVKANDGRNGGRICWAIAGSLCGGKIQGSFAEKLLNCIDCSFFKQVKKEEGGSFRLYP
jgi:hypothetical protein